MAGLTLVILVDIAAMGRIGFALCRDGLLPAAVGKVHPTYNIPARLTMGTTIVVAVIAAFVPIDTLADMVSIGTLFAFLVVAIAVVVPAPHQAADGPAVPDPQRPVAPGRLRRHLHGADGQPGHRDLAPLPHLAGHRARARGLRREGGEALGADGVD
jgi:Amino acid permease